MILNCVMRRRTWPGIIWESSCIGVGTSSIQPHRVRAFSDGKNSMSTECYPIATLLETTKLYRDYLAMGEGGEGRAVRRWYGATPFGGTWMRGGSSGDVDAAGLADALERQSVEFGAGTAALTNIARLRAGAKAVVTGQQVGLLGGPLMTLLKAATGVARARQATEATGVQHVPVFWLATEDHDLEEIDQVSLLTKASVETLRLKIKHGLSRPVGAIELVGEIDALLEQASELLGYAPVCDLLRECYGRSQPFRDTAPTFGGAFARLMARLFAAQGLIVMDAAGREFHALGSSTLRYAIEHAEGLEAALLARSSELEAAGYHAQVLVKGGASLLFLVSEDGERQALRRLTDGSWKASSKAYSTEELLGILETEPERLSPNALLRPVFQDTILPTAAYIGGPAEIAYFAKSRILPRALCFTRRFWDA
jgi:bacillithiol biosynthesis cysteine-adding enzyme BshC